MIEQGMWSLDHTGAAACMLGSFPNKRGKEGGGNTHQDVLNHYDVMVVVIWLDAMFQEEVEVTLIFWVCIGVDINYKGVRCGGEVLQGAF